MCKLSWSYIRQVSKEIKLFIFRSPWWDSLVHSRSDHKCSTPIVRSDQNNAPPKERPLSQKSLCQGIGIVIASNSNHLSFLYIISFSVCVCVSVLPIHLKRGIRTVRAKNVTKINKNPGESSTGPFRTNPIANTATCWNPIEPPMANGRCDRRRISANFHRPKGSICFETNILRFL